MRIETLIASAIVLDLLLGDPRWFPHPVRLIGCLALIVEKITRKIIKYEYVSGIVTVLLVIVTVWVVTCALIMSTASISQTAARALVVLIIYFSIAIKDLYAHSKNVYRALKDEDIESARKLAGMMVGR
ncbi:cobalamin biosynthesis protein, partial [Thermodesulfobacteriota bacterium]